MGRSHVGCSENVIGAHIPDVGKVSDDQAQSSANKSADLFHEEPFGLDLSHNAVDIVPYPAGVGDTLLFSGDGPRLTGDAGSDAIHFSAPRAAVEGGKIAPDRRVIQGLRFNLCDQVCDREGFPLHHTDCASAWLGESDSEVEAGVSCAERQDVGICSHKIIAPFAYSRTRPHSGHLSSGSSAITI